MKKEKERVRVRCGGEGGEDREQEGGRKGEGERH